LPKVMGDVAKGVKNFKSGLKDDDEEDERKALTSDAEPTTGEAAASLKRDEAAKG
jgi:sec-independent protein translocase protein TatA